MLIFENAPDWRLFFDGGGWHGTFVPRNVVFLDKNGFVFSFRIDREKESDTLVIPPMDTDYLELTMVHKSLNTLHFYIKIGDTILFTYDDNDYPILKSYTSDNLTRQYNFHRNIPSRLSYLGLEPITVFSRGGFREIYKRVQEGKSLPEIYRNQYFPMDTVEQQVASYLKEYEDLLKKQYADKILNEEGYNYHRYLLLYKQLEYALVNKTYSDLKELELKFVDFFSDDYADYYSYLLMLDRFRRIYSDVGKFPVRRASMLGSGFDDRLVFDSLSIKTFLPPRTRNHILYLLFNDIATSFPVDDALLYKERYVKLAGDSIRAQNILIERGIIIQTSEHNDIQVKDKQGDTLAFKTILEQLKGNVVYLDFFGSWCGPCRAAMPDAFKLRKEYENKDVAFVYLAINDREDVWKKTINDLQLNDNRAMNYFIVNSKSSKTIQELKIQGVPHYLIYDKTGKLVNHRAPGPYGVEIRKILDELLK